MTIIDWNAHISKRYTFTATYIRNHCGRMLLEDVRRIDGIQFRDHMFLPYTAKFKRLALQYGDTVRLTGKINRYFKRGEGQSGIPIYLTTRIPQLEITNITSTRKD